MEQKVEYNSKDKEINFKDQPIKRSEMNRIPNQGKNKQNTFFLFFAP